VLSLHACMQRVFGVYVTNNKALTSSMAGSRAPWEKGKRVNGSGNGGSLPITIVNRKLPYDAAPRRRPLP
jgi:hypothetical protein